MVKSQFAGGRRQAGLKVKFGSQVQKMLPRLFDRPSPLHAGKHQQLTIYLSVSLSLYQVSNREMERYIDRIG